MTSFLAALLMAGAANVSSQHYEHPLPADFNEPIRLYTTGLGTFTRSISSSNAEAQSYFNQGFQLMYGFAKVEAGRSFREAQKRDPECAICYWGEAWAWGPYVNGRMTVAHAERAYAAIQKAVALAEKHANPKEQALIRAMSVRYVEPAAGSLKTLPYKGPSKTLPYKWRRSGRGLRTGPTLMPWLAWPRPIPTIWMSAPSTPKHCSCCCRGRGHFPSPIPPSPACSPCSKAR